MSGDGDARIGIALSGGGSRAIAFHLGCLRLLHRAGLLDRAVALATVSGGSVIGGLYALHEGPFEAFEARVRKVLRRGLVGPALWTAVSSLEGVKALTCAILQAGLALAWPIRCLLGARDVGPPLRRFASRTTMFRLALHRDLYGRAPLTATGRTGRPTWIALAAELRTGSAFYFSAEHVGSWRFGQVAPTEFSVADAAAASAAFPALLPALDEIRTFVRADESPRTERVSLTDGGVYDNLALAPLWPDRELDASLPFPKVDTIILCRAGDGLRVGPPGVFLVGRLKATILAMHERAQNAIMKRMFDLANAGALKGVALAYLGQDESRLTHAPPDLIPREAVNTYPIDFSPMSTAWIDKLSRRGEQLTLAILRQHHPELLPSEMRA